MTHKLEARPSPPAAQARPWPSAALAGILPPSPPSPPAAVLIVDDEDRLRLTLTQMIQSLGYRARAVASAEACLRLLAQPERDVDILLLDLCLPGRDGMSLFHTVRERHRAIQVVVLTGFGDLPAAQEAIRLGVVEFLTKPCLRGDLERALGEADRRRHRRAAHLPDAQPDAPRPKTLDELEYQHIFDTLARHGGNRRAAAKALGISLRTLYYRLAQYGGEEEG